MNNTALVRTALAFVLATNLLPVCLAADTTALEQLAYWSSQSGRPGDALRGETFFNSKHGGTWSCASCHGSPPTATGRHADTGKTIAPLAPSSNAKALTRAAKIEKWLRRNCNDVLSRECTAAEKADLFAYLGSLK